MENTSDENYNVIILVKTTNHSLSAVQHTRCAENTEIVSHRVRWLDILGEREKGKGVERQQAQSNAKR